MNKVPCFEFVVKGCVMGSGVKLWGQGSGYGVRGCVMGSGVVL